MSKKGKKAVVLDSGPVYGADAKARMKYHDLLQDYRKLQKEADVARSKLEAGKQRKKLLAAEVRFLRRRYEHFAKSTALNSVQNLPTQNKHKMGFGRKEGIQKPPPIPKSKPVISNIQHHGKSFQGGKEAAQQRLTDLDHKGRTYIPKKKSKTGNITSVYDLNLNQDNTHSVKEVPFPSRHPTFDLNQVSTGDEDFQSNFESLKFADDEMQNDLRLSVCRNAGGEAQSCDGKRKISWQDPFALRV